MYAKGQTIIQLMERLAPKSLAMEGDKIGLQVGTLNKEVKRVMVALDVLEEVVDEAIEKKVDLIIAHHAVIFRPLKHLRTDLPAGRLYEKLIKHDIAVYIAHTNLDTAEGGINDVMSEMLGLTQTEVLAPTHEQKLKKVVVFIPKTHHEQVLQAMSEAGAGHIGNYSHCTFNLEGTGTFLPGEGTNPHIGEQGKLERVEEIRLETIIPEEIEGRVVAAMIKAHPYEEPAYDLYPLAQKGKTFGIGRIGKLPEAVTLGELVRRVKDIFSVEGVRVVGDPEKTVQKVAVSSGDGNKFVPQAIFKGADVMVTGDVYYHTAHDALQAGLAMIDPGHNVEKVMKTSVQRYLQSELQQMKSDTEVLASQIHTDPFRFM